MITVPLVNTIQTVRKLNRATYPIVSEPLHTNSFEVNSKVTINYSVVENKLTNGADQYMARVQPKGTLKQEDIVEAMLDRGTMLTHGDILNVLDEYHRAIQQAVLNGYNVITATANFSTSISGNFDNEDDTFTIERHALEASVNSGRALRKAVKVYGQVEVRESNERAPKLKSIYDSTTGERNGSITPSGTIRLSGKNLSFDPSDDAQGVFFTNNGTTVKATVITTNWPSRLVVDAPATLAAGEWEVEVRSKLDGVTEVREGKLRKPVTVA